MCCARQSVNELKCSGNPRTTSTTHLFSFLSIMSEIELVAFQIGIVSGKAKDPPSDSPAGKRTT